MSASPLDSKALAVGALLFCAPAAAEQDADPAYRSPVTAPFFAAGIGPAVCVDGGHHNFHALDGRFRPFGELLRSDGYTVRPIKGDLAHSDLGACGILVIANAQPNDDDWETYPYPTPPAFTAEEATALRRWVESGGALLLIADHMPFPGAAAPIAAAFGLEFNDGFAVEDFATEAAGHASFSKPTLFLRDDGTLRVHPVTDGSRPSDSVTRVRTFTGQAFRAPADAEPLLVLPANFISLMPRVAWKFTMETPRLPVGGWLQGAVMHVGRGRLAVFGEGAMFTAQLADKTREPMGMNAPLAEQNYRFVLNLMLWLAGELGASGQSAEIHDGH